MQISTNFQQSSFPGVEHILDLAASDNTVVHADRSGHRACDAAGGKVTYPQHRAAFPRDTRLGPFEMTPIAFNVGVALDIDGNGGSRVPEVTHAKSIACN
jgi:hypothetical protein